MRIPSMFKTTGFYFTLALFLLPTVVTVVRLDWTWATFPVKILLFFLWMILFIGSEWYRSGQLSNEEAKRQAVVPLGCVETLKILNPGQNLRSNIFIRKAKEGYYYIWHHYRMETDLAKDVTKIPEGKGCTGAAWENEEQVWGDRADIFSGGRYALPLDEEKKVSQNMEWICSTPIYHRKRVIGVLNFDGDKPVSAEQKEFIKKHAIRVAGELAPIMSKASLA